MLQQLYKGHKISVFYGSKMCSVKKTKPKRISAFYPNLKIIHAHCKFVGFSNYPPMQKLYC